VPRSSVFVCPSTGLVITRLRDEGVPNGSGRGVGFVPPHLRCNAHSSQRSPLGVKPCRSSALWCPTGSQPKADVTRSRLATGRDIGCGSGKNENPGPRLSGGGPQWGGVGVQ